MIDKGLKSELINKESRICGVLMEFLEVLLNSYSFARRLALIESEIEEAEQKEPMDKEEE